ncbi:MAG: hypothetical protein M2R45_03606 [Verrucomicrobia subdivision 3 bacterium]|nr:hypothetical protein [Limisphaerales bacterium]MCS1416899.1 hypothetical protein [Limisphaerales bacterium]
MGISDPILSEDILGLATTVLLAARRDLSPVVTRAVLEAVYEGRLHYRFPALFLKDEVVEKSLGPLAYRGGGVLQTS